MKKILIPALATLLLLASACSQKSEYTNALPMQVETIIAIQPAKLADKAELDNASLQKLKDLLKKDTDATLQEYYETLLDDPAQSGIDFDSPIYLFNIRPAVNSGFIAAAKVADEANVQTLVDALQKQGLVSGTTSTDGGYTLTEGKLLMAYNASTLLMLGADAATNRRHQSRLFLRQSAQGIQVHRRLPDAQRLRPDRPEVHCRSLLREREH